MVHGPEDSNLLPLTIKDRLKFGMGECDNRLCAKKSSRYFVWPMFSDGTGEYLTAELCRKHGKNFAHIETINVREVTKAELAIIQVMES